MEQVEIDTAYGRECSDTMAWSTTAAEGDWLPHRNLDDRGHGEYPSITIHERPPVFGDAV